jgi:hypothetical protein
MSAEQQDPQAPPALPLVKDDRFEEVLALIQGARQRVAQAVNTQLIDLYWQVGAYIGRKLERAEWGGFGGKPAGCSPCSDAAGPTWFYQA